MPAVRGAALSHAKEKGGLPKETALKVSLVQARSSLLAHPLAAEQREARGTRTDEQQHSRLRNEPDEQLDSRADLLVGAGGEGRQDLGAGNELDDTADIRGVRRARSRVMSEALEGKGLRGLGAASRGPLILDRRRLQ